MTTGEPLSKDGREELLELGDSVESEEASCRAPKDEKVPELV